MEKLTWKSLAGGSLARLMADRMIEDAGLRKKFEAKLHEPDEKSLAAFAKLHGWAPPKELAEWEGASGAYRAFFESISDVWMIGGSVGYAAGKKRPALSDFVNHDVVTLLTGLVRFGDDPSGDSCFVSTLPNPKDVAEVHVFNHENGELDGTLYYSLGDFVFSNWGEEDKSLMGAFNKEMEGARKKLDPLLDARALFNRMKWMWSLPTGEPGYHFAEDMDRAPSFDAWTAEKKALADKPWLTSYWMLAHYFLGNAAACAEAVALGAKAPGALTPELAEVVGALLADPKKAKLGKLGPKKLAELCAAVRKNADERLLEPAVRASVAKTRDAGVTKANPKDLAARLAKGEDGWALIAAFPDDVAAHDLVLAALAKEDKALSETVKRYEKARAEEDIWDAWPSRWDQKKTAFDRRLSPVVGAAFRAGLKFDSDHKRAASSLVNTLAFLDDDVAMDCFAVAIEACKADDPRLEYVVKALRASKHPRAAALQVRAAWRFFEHFGETKKSMKKTEKEGPTLDNMFRVHSHLLGALLDAIRRGDDESEKLVDKVCSITHDMTVLGPAYASAFRQVGNKRLERHEKTALAYCRMVDQVKGQSLPDYALYNLAEAAIAIAKLTPEKAGPFLRGMLEKERDNADLRLEVVGAVLGGLLVLAPSDPELLGWTERILGNRTNNPRVYGTLRGVVEGKVAGAKDWLRWHAYVGCSSNHIGEKPAVNNAARAALAALGEPEPPPFDEEDEFASKRKDEDLPAALLENHHHLTDWVFKRIVERKLRSPEVVRVGGQVLRDVFRFSADDGDRATCDERTEGLKCMLFQGAPALPALAELLALPHMAGKDKTIVLSTMSVMTNVPALFAKLAKASEAEVLAMLEAPTAEVMGALDVVAAWALAAFGERAHAAIEAAVRWRFAFSTDAYDHWIEDETTAAHLANIAARLPKGKAIVDSLARKDAYHVKELLKRVRALPRPDLDACADAQTFEQQMKEHGGPKYTCTLDAGAMTWAGDDIYCQGIVSENRYEQKGAVPAAAMANVRRALVALGLAPPAAAAKKKKGRR